MASLDPNVLRLFLAESGASYTQNKRSYIFTCPRCNSLKKLHMLKSDGRFICWKCAGDGFKGRPEYALAEILNESIVDIKRKLYGDAGPAVEVYLNFKLTDFFGDDDVDEEAALQQIPTKHWPVDYYPIDHPKGARGVEYLAKRGIPIEVAKRYGVRYSPVQRRVIFPIQESESLYGWQERLVISNEWEGEDGEIKKTAKVLTSTGTPKEKLLMFVDRLKGQDHAILCEGPIDAIKADLCGGNVCSMGKAVTKEQITLILNAGIKKIYIALDEDAATDIQRIVKDYRDEVELYDMVIKGGEGKDIGDLSFEEAYSLFLNAPRIMPGRLFTYLKPVNILLPAK